MYIVQDHAFIIYKFTMLSVPWSGGAMVVFLLMVYGWPVGWGLNSLCDNILELFGESLGLWADHHTPKIVKCLCQQCFGWS